MEVIVNTYIYEKINLNPNIPALMAYVGEENIDIKNIII